jgi:hypothetical protein
MSNVDKNDEIQILNFYSIWLCIYLVVPIAMVFIIPFPFSFYACMLVLVLHRVSGNIFPSAYGIKDTMNTKKEGGY